MPQLHDFLYIGTLYLHISKVPGSSEVSGFYTFRHIIFKKEEKIQVGEEKKTPNVYNAQQ